MTRLKDLKKRLMEDDPEFQEEYARADDEFALIEALVRARAAAKLTQAELAQRLGTTQSAVARLEGGRVSPSFATLRRYAEATGTRLTVGLERIASKQIATECALSFKGSRTSRAAGDYSFSTVSASVEQQQLFLIPKAQGRIRRALAHAGIGDRCHLRRVVT